MVTSSAEKPKEELVIPSKANKIGKDFLEELQREKEGQDSTTKPADNGKLNQSLEALAVKELMQEAEGTVKNESKDALTLPVLQATDAQEATLEDYENIPVEDFGKAMLRGMGWNPTAGIGKNQRVVAPAELQLRPKGMGLGADKMAVSNPVTYSTSSKDVKALSLGTGCGAQVVAGPSKGLYGMIISHNEDTGRCIVKLEIGGTTVSVNENFLSAVSKEDYAANSRVINADKFKRYNPAFGANQSRNQPSRNESPRNEPPRNEPPRNETSRNESSRNESSRNESSRNEFPRKEFPRKDFSRNDSSRNDSSRNEFPRKDFSRNESSRNDSSRNDASHERGRRSPPDYRRRRRERSRSPVK